MSAIKIYGASDDLVEISGDLQWEGDSYDKPTYLLFNDGTQVKVEYGDGGVWKVNRVSMGKAKSELMLGLPDDAPEKQCHGDKDAPYYSDVVTLTWDKPFALVKHGHKKLSAPPPEQAGAADMANKVIEYLDKRKGFDEWWHDIDADIKNDILDGLAKILSSKAASGHRIVGKTFVITGTLSIPRNAIKRLIEEAGGTVSNALSAKTDYLVVGDEPGDKLDQAIGLDIRRMCEDELRSML